MGKVIACVNEKGGVAKTTTIKNLSVGVASRGYKVLSIDLDTSCGLTKSLGLEESGTICQILTKSFESMKNPTEDEIFPEGFGIVESEEGIDVVTSSESLRTLENTLFTAEFREILLREYIDSVRDKYDYIFLDCPAGLGIFVDNALCVVDSVIIPTEANFLDTEAMQNLWGKISAFRRYRKRMGEGIKPEIMGIVFTKVRFSTKNNKEMMAKLRKDYKDSINIFDSYISINSKIPESDLARKSIFKYAKNSTAALNYNSLVDEFLSMQK